MGKFGKFSASQFKKLQTELNKLQESDMDAFAQACAKELAARLLRGVIQKTPVGIYPEKTKKKGGTLKRGWTAKTHEEAASGKKTSAKKWAESLEIKRIGDTYIIDIINPVEYVSYVEHGHRTANHKGWVPGRFMLKTSEQELQDIAPKVLESKIKKFLGKCMQ